MPCLHDTQSFRPEKRHSGSLLLYLAFMAIPMLIPMGNICSADEVATSAPGQTHFSEIRRSSIDWKKVAQRVEIRRDTYGIPHILAKDERAAFFGFGYAQAEDHMVEIARSLLQARGVASRYFGKKYVENDFAMHRLDNLLEARKDLERISPAFRTVVHAYAAGLNHYVASHGSRLPVWVKKAGPFTAADVLALIRARSVHTVLSTRVIGKLLKKYGSSKYDPTTHVPHDGAGSNAFALAGGRTKNGHPILLASPHLRWSALYWEAQITVPGSMNFFGNTLAGYPVLWAGFNHAIGWGNTVNHADLDDIYALKIDPEHPDSYLFDGKSIPLQHREVTIEVLDDNGHLVEVKRKYWYSGLGPILLRTHDHAFAIKSARLDSPISFEGFYRLAHAESLDEFMDVFRNRPVFSCNFIYADKDGNILYLWQARLPKRPDDGTDYALDIHVDSMKHVWHSLHAFRDMPKLLNPLHGVVTNSNNPPWWASPRDWIDPKTYPSYYEHGPLALRPQLAMSLLGQQKKYSVQDVIDLTFNTRMLLAERTLPDLLKALRKASPSSEDASAALHVLQDWDRRVSSGSRGAVLFKRFWDTYSKALPQPFRQPWNKKMPTSTPRGLADPALAVRHAEKAVRWTRNHYGSAAVPWGEVHRLRSRRYDLPGDGASGSYGTFHVLSYADAPDGKKVVGLVDGKLPLAGFGSNWTMLVEFSQPVRAWSVLASGESSHLKSPHSDDQLKLFQEHKLRPVWFTRREIDAHLERRYHP